MEPALALQVAVRALLANTASVTTLVPDTSILDLNQRPSVMPAILIGEGQTVPDTGLARDRHQVYLDFHIWAQEAGTALSKQIAGAIRDALFDALWSIPALVVADAHITSARFLRDPDSVHSHAVMTLTCRVKEAALQ